MVILVERKTKKQNNVVVKAAVGTLILVFLSIAIFIIADLALPFKDVGSRGGFKELMIHNMLLTTGISLLMLILSTYLTYIYLKDYLELKSKFTLGILFAIISFMLFAITSNPLFHLVFGIYGKEGIFRLIPLVFATISLAILTWISSK